MNFAQFVPAMRQLLESGGAQVRFGENVELSLPIVVRRGDCQYDAMFLYQRPGAEQTAPRPHAWMLLDAESGGLVHYSLCVHSDFMPHSAYPVGCELPMELPKPLTQKKRATMQQKLLEAYEEIRTFAFAEPLTRPQAAAVATYKDLFHRMSYPAHYPFYHALSPTFLHWLRMPLPQEALSGAPTAQGEEQQDGVQLLILEHLQRLVQQFQDDIAEHARKDRLFDEMHRELQEYKNGMLESLTRAMELDVIRVIDDVAKSAAAYREKEGTAEDYRKLFALLEGIETDLVDLLYRHGVEPYTVEQVDVARQKVLQSLPTDDPALDKTVAVHHARGWEKEGKMIRPEWVSVYLYKGEQPHE